MRLISARLQRIRQHGQLELSFAPGLCLIGGANESGKSTAVEALHKALFLKANAGGRGVAELRSQLHSGLPEVELRFAAAGQDWVLRKRFAGTSGTCQLNSAGGAALQGSSAETRLAELLQVSGPIEGRRLAQLPLRWAHLWVRQGDAGSDLLASGGEAYDLPQLVQQLQRSSGSDALDATASAFESPLDRQVQALVQQRLELQLTATGKVRAGSPLAQAEARQGETHAALHLAQQRLNDLAAAMEQLQRINQRLQELEPLRQRLSAAEPLQRRLLQLQGQRRQLLALGQQRQNDSAQHSQLLQELEHSQQQLDTASKALGAVQQHQAALEQRQQSLERDLAELGLRRDLAALKREAAQLQSHKTRFEALQQQASGLKQQLQALPPIDTTQVRQLRQAEQQLAQAQARCQGMATRIELLASDAAVPISLDGQGLEPGQAVLLEQPAELQLGSGTRLRISPGGGSAIGEATTQRQRAERQLAQLRQSLGLDDSDAAERLAQQRQSLETELSSLRQAAATIPWAGLDQQLAGLETRRKRLLAALAELGAQVAPSEPENSMDPELTASASEGDLEQRQLELRQRQQALAEERQQLERQRVTLQQQREQLNLQLQRQQGEAGRLAGAITTTTSQLKQLELQGGSAEHLENEERELRSQLPEADGLDDAPQQLARLEAEKDDLLTSRGQQEQLCRSLGAGDPWAELEQLQAAWEQAQAERDALARSTMALQLLQAEFHAAQEQTAAQYCLPLQQALRGYLDALGVAGGGEALLAYDPAAGFADLRLQRDTASFSYAQLSGGMREQLGAALRLALAEVLRGAYDGCLPLVFDDAFSNCDPLRLAGVRRMLARAVERGLQVIVFSCTPSSFAPLVSELGAAANQLQL